MIIDDMREKFTELYGGGDEAKAFFAPGRVNLIGEHTDYNGGHVFPCALQVGTYGLIRKRDDDIFRFYSTNFPDDGVITVSGDEIEPGKEKRWVSYPEGLIWTFAQKGYPIPGGADMLFTGDVPQGSGLSSSASLEVLTALMLRDTFGIDVTQVDLALFGQYSENNFNGMNCGIMDQFASAMGKKDCAIFLDTNTLKYEYAPIKLDGIHLIVTNSNVKHALVDSEYNTRRAQCDEALKDLQKVKDIPCLCAMSPAEFEEVKDAIPDLTVRKRARHAIYEDARTVQALEVLKDGDIDAFGRLMDASHVSMRDDFEISCPEMDILVEEAWKIDGCLGSRMTGGGFGGCSVSLVRSDDTDEFITEVGKAYTEKTGLTPEFYIIDISEGAHPLDE